MTRPVEIKHGNWGYQHHGCRCEICREANALKKRKWREKKRG